eukprot:9498934-Pyramimonas_sp.AAC.1
MTGQSKVPKKHLSDPQSPSSAKRQRISGKRSDEEKHYDALYGPRDNIRLRFPGLSGLRLLNKVNLWYRVRKDTVLPFFHTLDKSKQLVMLEDSYRDQEAV